MRSIGNARFAAMPGQSWLQGYPDIVTWSRFVRSRPLSGRISLPRVRVVRNTAPGRSNCKAGAVDKRSRMPLAKDVYRRNARRSSSTSTQFADQEGSIANGDESRGVAFAITRQSGQSGALVPLSAVWPLKRDRTLDATARHARPVRRSTLDSRRSTSQHDRRRGRRYCRNSHREIRTSQSNEVAASPVHTHTRHPYRRPMTCHTWY
jgi:hypothetical protein